MPFAFITLFNPDRWRCVFSTPSRARSYWYLSEYFINHNRLGRGRSRDDRVRRQAKLLCRTLRSLVTTRRSRTIIAVIVTLRSSRATVRSFFVNRDPGSERGRTRHRRRGAFQGVERKRGIAYTERAVECERYQKSFFFVFTPNGNVGSGPLYPIPSTFLKCRRHWRTVSGDVKRKPNK